MRNVFLFCENRINHIKSLFRNDYMMNVLEDKALIPHCVQVPRTSILTAIVCFSDRA